MSINTLYANSNLNAAMLDFIDQQQGHKANSIMDHLDNAKNMDESLNTNSLRQKSSVQNKKATQAYSGGINSDIGRSALNRALSELSTKIEGKITLDKVYEHKKNLEAEFTVGLRLAVIEKGIDPEQEFQIAMDTQGRITVNCDDANTKTLVEKFLKENPKVNEQFGYIQALSNLETAQKSSVWQGESNIKATITSQAIENMFSDTLDTGVFDFASMSAQYYGLDEETAFYTGLNFTI